MLQSLQKWYKCCRGFKIVANVAETLSFKDVANVPEPFEMLQMLQKLKKCCKYCRGFKNVENVAGCL